MIEGCYVKVTPFFKIKQMDNTEQICKVYENDHVNVPNRFEPVLALIMHQGDLGKSEWYEVVYFYQEWCSYAESKTFEDGERVIKWKYVTDCL